MKLSISNEKIHAGNLVLVNADFPMQAEDEKELIPVGEQYPEVLLKHKAVKFLELIFQKINSGHKIVPVSGYRSAKEQTDIYETSLRDNGEAFTQKFVALPYHSEHQTGLAIDLGLKKKVIDFICPEFPYDGICDEFRKAAPDYGFIERYPNGKEQITGIAHEPWHFRYVGYPHSKIMSTNNYTLEEYIEFVKQFSYGSHPLRLQGKGNNIEIFYVTAESTGITTITLPEDTVYQVSGNNTDGFVVTLWRNSNE